MMLELAPAWLWEVPKASGLGNLTSKLVSKSKKNSLFVQNVQIGYSFKEKQLSSSEFSIRNVWVVGCPPSICKNWRSFAICQNKNRNFPMNVCITSRRQIESLWAKTCFHTGEHKASWKGVFPMHTNTNTKQKPIWTGLSSCKSGIFGICLTLYLCICICLIKKIPAWSLAPYPILY